MSPNPDADNEYYDAKLETAPAVELEAVQLHRIRRVVRYAYRNLPFYHRRWRAAGILPEDIRTLVDFQKIPTFTKEDLRAATTPEDITGGITSCATKAVSNYAMTSGTTGVNTFVGLSPSFVDEFVQEHAMREYWMAKMRPGMRVFMVPAGWHFFGMAQNMVLTRMGAICVSPWGSLFHRYVPQIVKALATLSADYFVGIPWVISALFEEGKRIGMEPKQLFSGIGYISLAGEPVPPGLRDMILRETEVTDVYESGGSVDGLWGGSDCLTHTGHHIWTDSNLIEVFDLNGRDPISDGSRGRVVSTNLRLGGPLYVRFLGDDLAKKSTEKCGCGRTHPRVELYDRLVNSFRIHSMVATPYDVASVLHKVLDYRPFTILNPHESMERLRVMVAKRQEDENRTLLAKEINEHCMKELGIGMEIDWVDIERLPFAHRKLLQVVRKDDLGLEST